MRRFKLDLTLALVVCMGGWMASCAQSEKEVSSAAQKEFVSEESDLENEGFDFDDYRSFGFSVPEILRVCNSSHVDFSELQKYAGNRNSLSKVYSLMRNGLSPLGVLCNRSKIDIDALRFLLDQGVYIDEYNVIYRKNNSPKYRYDYMPAISVALSRSKVDMNAVKILFNAYSNRMNDKLLPGMMNAAVSRSRVDVSALRELVKLGADVNAAKEGMTPLMALCDRSEIDEEGIRVLLELGADINLVEGKTNKSAVMFAADRKTFDASAVKMLLDNGADVNAVDSEGVPVLHYVCRDIELIKKVLRMGADPFAEDNHGGNLLDAASAFGEPEVVRFLIDQGFKVNHVANGNGWTPLMYAAYSNQLDVVRVLVESGANPDVYDNKEGNGVLSLALMEHNFYHERVRAWEVQNDMVRYLIEMGIDVNHVSGSGRTPIFEVASRKEEVLETVKILIDAGADVHHRTNQGETLLMVVQDPEVARLLIELGVDLDVVDNMGKTALHHAFIHKNSEVTRLLIDSGANLFIRDKEGKNAGKYYEVYGDFVYYQKKQKEQPEWEEEERERQKKREERMKRMRESSLIIEF